MVARIAEALALAGGEKVLDVGTGSGYQAAVLAELAGEVHTIERIPELAEQARENLAAAGYDRVQVHVGDGSLGLPDEAPFTAIAVAAAAPGLPELLYDQLEPRGRLAVPVGGRWGQRLEVIVRSPEGPAIVHSVPCRFVPLVGEQGFGSEACRRSSCTEPCRASSSGSRRATGRARSASRGWVRNAADGSVEAVFEGEDERVESMVSWCSRGPRGARVDEVDVTWAEPQARTVSRFAEFPRHAVEAEWVSSDRGRATQQAGRPGRHRAGTRRRRDPRRAGERPVGFDVLCGDGSHRFLPYATALLGGEAVEVGSPLVLLGRDQLDFYRRHGRALRS